MSRAPCTTRTISTPLPRGKLEDDVLAYWDAAKLRCQFWPASSHVGPASQSPEVAVNESGELIGVFHAVFGYVSPDLGQIHRRTWPYDDARHSLAAGGRVCSAAFAAFALHLRSAPRSRRAAVQALLNVVPKLLQLRSSQLVLRFHQTQRLAHHLAGRVVASGGNFLTDQTFEFRGEVDVDGHGTEITALAKIVND